MIVPGFGKVGISIDANTYLDCTGNSVVGNTSVKIVCRHRIEFRLHAIYVDSWFY